MVLHIIMVHKAPYRRRIIRTHIRSQPTVATSLFGVTALRSHSHSLNPSGWRVAAITYWLVPYFLNVYPRLFIFQKCNVM